MFEYISERFFVNLHQKRGIERALNLEKSGDKENALKIFRDLVIDDPNCKPCRFYMARVTMAIKQQTEENAEFDTTRPVQEHSNANTKQTNTVTST